MIWNPEETDHCPDVNDLYLASTVFSIVSDMAMLRVFVYFIRLELADVDTANVRSVCDFLDRRAVCSPLRMLW